MGDFKGAKGDLRARDGLELWVAAVEMLRESLGLTDRDASILMVLLIKQIAEYMTMSFERLDQVDV